MSKARAGAPPQELEDGPVMLQQYLKDNELSYRQFAAQLGCTKAHVCGLVNGTSRPSLDMAVKIEALTGGLIGSNSWTPPPPARRARA